MALSVVLGTIFGYIRKRGVDREGGGAPVTREFLAANTLFYGFLFVGILFFQNWFNFRSPAFTAVGLALVSVLRNAEYTKADHIGRLYLERAQNFEETLTFLSAVAGVSEDGSNTIESSLPSFLDEAETQSWILSCLFNSGNVYRNGTARYRKSAHVLM